MKRTSWNRVRRDRCCPICGKPDWCLIAADQSAAICARIESDKPAGQAGWVHRLTDNDWTPVQWIPVPKLRPTPAVDLDELNDRCRQSLRPESKGWLSNELGISVESLEAFQAGWNPDRKVFSFPMRRNDDSISGIRYRTYDGKKFSETGGRDGLFFVPGSIGKTLIIVEGPTDAMAIRDLGFRSVIGRSNCRGNVDQIMELVRQLQPGVVIVIPDNDQPGIAGGKDLWKRLIEFQMSRFLQLPDGTKDARACIQDTKNADWLTDQIGKEINLSRRRQASEL